MQVIVFLFALLWAAGAYAMESPTSSALQRDAAQSTTLDVSTLTPLDAIIEKLADKRIVYVGEIHARYSHHLVQLEIIKALAKTHTKTAVGLEMFQAPFQSVLDDYIAGMIDEKTFLKKSEYFSRWGFDYQLYKPIIDFARSSRIPLVALNARRELTEKVSRNGLESLSPEERREVPGDVDFSDEGYRKRLKESFYAHKTLKNGSFEFFVQAQLLWDETMAEKIDAFMRGHEGYRMIVLAGNGHLAYRSGIPSRVTRRNGLPSAIVLCDAEVAPGIADFVVFPADAASPKTPQLMVRLKEERGRVVISEFLPESVAQKAGLRIGDVISSLDGSPVQTGDDVRIHMTGKKPGDSVRVTVLRKGFLFSEKTLTVDVHL